MANTSLYRRYRPETFDDVIGQDHIVRTLKNQIATDTVGHAYLFTGTRGTGKTSVARIFARASRSRRSLTNSCSLSFIAVPPVKANLQPILRRKETVRLPVYHSSMPIPSDFSECTARRHRKCIESVYTYVYGGTTVRCCK